MSAAPIPVETLLAHREWVRAVARAVVRDESAADDVEQETWLAALRSPPRDQSSLRGWFGAVTRSRARRIGRSESRDAREAAAARPEATPSSADLAELADTHRRVVQAVVELDEPYRESILLRYFEGLAIDDVAKRSGVPLETTRSRLKRGVAKLRERLAEELGEDDRPWEMALVPLIGRSDFATGGAGVAVGGGLLMASTTKTAVAVAAVLLLVGGGAFVASKWSPGDAQAVAAAPDAPVAPPAPVARQEKPVAVPRPPRARAEDPVPAPAAPEEPKPKPPEATVLERLQRTKMTADWTDAPLVGVIAELAARTEVEIAFSKEAYDVVYPDAKIGRLSLDREVGADQLLGLVTQLKGVAWTVEEPRVVIVLPGAKRDTSLPLVVPPKWTPPGPVDVTGRVTDANGIAVAGAEIVQILRDAKPVATTDAAGRYDVKLAWPYGSMEARMAGQVRSFTASVSGAPGTKVTLDFALRGVAGSLAVRTKTDAGPLAGVEVSLGAETPTSRSDERPLTQSTLTARTDAQGVAVFPSVMPGVAMVYARLKDFDTGRANVKVTAAERAEIEIVLEPKTSMKERLDRKHVSFNFSGATPRDAVQFLNDATNSSIIIDPAIAERLRTFDLTLSVKDVTLRDALRQICEQIGGVTFDVHEKEEIVWIHAAR